MATSGVTFERVTGGDGRGARTDAEGPVEEGEGEDRGVVPPGDGLHVHLDHLARRFSSTLVNHDPAVGATRIRERRTLRTNPTRLRGGRRRYARAPGVSSDLARACDGCPRESSVRRRAILHGARRYGAVSRRATRHRHRNGFFVTEVSVAWSVTQGNLQTAAAISNFSDRIDRLFRSNGFRSTRVSSAFFIGDSRVFGIGASRGARLEAEASESATPARSRR